MAQEKLELVVMGDSRESVVRELATVDLMKERVIHRRDVGGLFIVEARVGTEFLTDEFYENIRQRQNIGIISDTASWKRSKVILNEVYRAENELRKLLLHVIDLVPFFYLYIAEKSKYTKTLPSQQRITFKDNLNPLSSMITLGELMVIFETDLSWSGRQPTVDEIRSMLRDANDLSAFNAMVNQRLTPKSIWSVISENVLQSPVEWREVSNIIKVLKGFRDMAAHFQIVTDSNKSQLVRKAETLARKVKQKKLNSSEKAKLKELLRVHADVLSRWPYGPGIPQTEEAISKEQSYSIPTRLLLRATQEEIREAILDETQTSENNMLLWALEDRAKRK